MKNSRFLNMLLCTVMALSMLVMVPFAASARETP